MAEQQAEQEISTGKLSHSENFGSLEKGRSGDYQLAVGAVVREAWERVAGNKGTIWLAILLYCVVNIALSFVLGWLTGSPGETPQEASPMGLVQQAFVAFATIPLWVGITFIGVAIASDRPARATSIVSWYGKIIKLFVTYVLMMLMILIGLLLLVLPGVYLMVAYQLALPLVADKDLGPWEALETSRKAVTHKWFTFFGLWLIAAVVIMASMLLIGIPMIWLLPAFIIGAGILYRNTFGVELVSLERAAGK